MKSVVIRLNEATTVAYALGDIKHSIVGSASPISIHPYAFHHITILDEDSLAQFVLKFGDTYQYGFDKSAVYYVE